MYSSRYYFLLLFICNKECFYESNNCSNSSLVKKKKIPFYVSLMRSASCQHSHSCCSCFCKAVLLFLLWEISVSCLWEMQKYNDLIISSKGSTFLRHGRFSFMLQTVLYRMRHMYNLKTIACIVISDFTRNAYSKLILLQAKWTQTFSFCLFSPFLSSPGGSGLKKLHYCLIFCNMCFHSTNARLLSQGRSLPHDLIFLLTLWHLMISSLA